MSIFLSVRYDMTRIINIKSNMVFPDLDDQEEFGKEIPLNRYSLLQ